MSIDDLPLYFERLQRTLKTAADEMQMSHEEARSFLHEIRTTPQRLNYRYWNANFFAVAIVAKEGTAQDYACYIGATEGVKTTLEQTLAYVLRYGCKIEPALAEHLFPEFKAAGLEYRP